MDNSLQAYIQQQNQLPTPEELNALSQANNTNDASQQLLTNQNPNVNPLAQYLQNIKNNPNPIINKAQNTYAGLCQKFVEDNTYGHSGIFPTAAAAWNAYAKQGRVSPDVQNAPAGSLIYFAPDKSNGDAGHVGISLGNGLMRSATYNGVQTNRVSDWVNSTNQKPLGYALP